MRMSLIMIIFLFCSCNRSVPREVLNDYKNTIGKPHSIISVNKGVVIGPHPMRGSYETFMFDLSGDFVFYEFVSGVILVHEKFSTFTIGEKVERTINDLSNVDLLISDIDAYDRILKIGLNTIINNEDYLHNILVDASQYKDYKLEDGLILNGTPGSISGTRGMSFRDYPYIHFLYNENGLKIGILLWWVYPD